MKRLTIGITLLLAIGSFLLISGCIVTQNGTEIVIEETICVNIDTKITDPNFSAAVVCDKFRERLEALLDEHGLTYDDIVDCSIVSGSYHTLGNVKNNPFSVEAEVTMERQDISDGPFTFLNFTSETIADLNGKKVPADLNAAGVGVVNRAMEDIKNGGDASLLMRLENADFDPEPSAQNPLDFRWQACVAFQFVLANGD